MNERRWNLHARCVFYQCEVPNCFFESTKNDLIHHRYRVHGLFTDLIGSKSSIQMPKTYTIEPEPTGSACTDINDENVCCTSAQGDTGRATNCLGTETDAVDAEVLLSAVASVRYRKSKEERTGPRVRKKKPWCPNNPKRRHKKLPCPDCERHEASTRGLNIDAPEFVPSELLSIKI